MTPEHTKELVEIYPELFTEWQFGFECDDGWFDLLRDCIGELKQVCQEKNLDVKATQIKEKFGTLRFYTDYYYDSIGPILEKAEDRSEKTCEKCGKSGQIRKLYWVQTLCDECLQKIS